MKVTKTISSSRRRRIAEEYMSAQKLRRPKVSVTIRVDADIVQFFKSRGPRYQTKMNNVLRRFVDNVGKLYPEARK